VPETMAPVPTRTQYFERLASIQGIGTDGLEKLREARVAVVGCGGVGSAAAEYLARSGIGNLRLIDQDIVSPSNLHRLQGAGAGDLYLPKAEVMAKALSTSMPWMKLDPIVDTIRSDNADDLLSDLDLIMDGLDNFRTRYVLNNYSVNNNVPYLFTSAIANQGHLALLHPPDTACLECVFPSIVSNPRESCESLGVTSNIVSTIGALAANEAMKFLLGQVSRLNGSLMTLDLAGPEFVLSKLTKRRDCRQCGVARETTGGPRDQGGQITLLCGETSACIIPTSPQELNLEIISLRLNPEKVLACSANVLVFQDDGISASLFKSGRLLLDGIKSEDDAREKSKKIWDRLRIRLKASLQVAQQS
jgi:molybdopterin/thiamine biosynthesis adenylyltransferase